MERRDADLKFRIVRGCGQEHADAPHPFRLLPPRCERPRRRRDMKRTGTAQASACLKPTTARCIEADLINIRNNRVLVRSFFKAPDVAYIADG